MNGERERPNELRREGERRGRFWLDTNLKDIAGHVSPNRHPELHLLTRGSIARSS
jgi:hypothetical protein